MGSVRLDSQEDMIFAYGQYALGISFTRDIEVRLQCLLEGIINSAQAAFHYLAELYTKGLTFASVTFQEQSCMNEPKIDQWAANGRAHSEIAARSKELAKNYFKAIFNPPNNLINLIALQ